MERNKKLQRRETERKVGNEAHRAGIIDNIGTRISIRCPMTEWEM